MYKMVTKKTVDLGEYVVNITYNNETGSIAIEVLDELRELIESIDITNVEGGKDDDDDDDDNDVGFNIDINLN